MARALKVYRTVAGFHDAYVAAPSQKAALAAWGSDKNLFARGDAEQVEDPALMAAPLADPGTVVRLSRGTTAAQIAAMPDPPAQDTSDDDDDARPHPAAARGKADTPAAPAKPRRSATPRPSNERLVAAEQALEALQATQRAERRDLEDREAALAHDRQTLDRRHHADEDAAEQALQAAKDAYDAAVKRWKA